MYFTITLINVIATVVVLLSNKCGLVTTAAIFDSLENQDIITNADEDLTSYTNADEDLTSYTNADEDLTFNADDLTSYTTSIDNTSLISNTTTSLARATWLQLISNNFNLETSNNSDDDDDNDDNNYSTDISTTPFNGMSTTMSTTTINDMSTMPFNDMSTTMPFNDMSTTTTTPQPLTKIDIDENYDVSDVSIESTTNGIDETIIPPAVIISDETPKTRFETDVNISNEDLPMMTDDTIDGFLNKHRNTNVDGSFYFTNPESEINPGWPYSLNRWSKATIIALSTVLILLSFLVIWLCVLIYKVVTAPRNEVTSYELEPLQTNKLPDGAV